MSRDELTSLHETLSRFVTEHGTARDEEHVHALQQRIRRLLGRMKVRNDG